MAALGRQDNITVCQHYRAQRAWVHSVTSPTLADGLRMAADIAVDAGQAAPGSALHRDLSFMETDQGAGRSVYAVSRRVLADCEALGVRF